MKRLRHSVWAPLAAGLVAVAAAVLFVALSATRLSGDTVAMSLFIAAAMAFRLECLRFLDTMPQEKEQRRDCRTVRVG